MKKKKMFETTEWAVKNVNLIQGCEFDCKYCCAKDIAIRFKRKTTGNWSNVVIDLKLVRNGRCCPAIKYHFKLNYYKSKKVEPKITTDGVIQRQPKIRSPN